MKYIKSGVLSVITGFLMVLPVNAGNPSENLPPEWEHMAKGGEVISPEEAAQNEWEIADIKVLRLSPSEFPQLPIKIKKELVKRQCLIPQTFISTQPHNVIQGQFQRKGQEDWAVLCSTGRVSSILIFWGGASKQVASTASSPDINSLQGIDDRKIGYSREISVVGRKYILEYLRHHGGPTPPPITHDGIENSFIDKFSTVFYYYKGNWVPLTGAD